jgi:hypothetical protein
MNGGAIAAVVIFCLIIAGVLFYAFSDHRTNSASNGTATTSTTGQGAAGASGKGNVGGAEGVHAGEGGGASSSGR